MLTAECRYAYDASNRLVRIQTPAQTGWRIWQGSHVANELRTTTDQTQQLTWLQVAGQPLAQLQSGVSGQKMLLAGDSAGSTLLEGGTDVRTPSYAPHGFRGDGRGAQAEPAFNGERLDAGSGCYLLGPGHHRPYSPTLGLFLAPDRAGPFGAGGLNTLSYCAGDPINRRDPSGHFWKWIVAAVGLVVGAAAVSLSFGTAAPAFGVLAAGGLGALNASGAAAIAGVGLGVAGMAVEAAAFGALLAGDAKTAGILGWVGLGLGVAGAAPALGKAALKGATQLAGKAKRFGQRLGRTRPPSPTPADATPPPAATESFSREGGRLWQSGVVEGRFRKSSVASNGPGTWPGLKHNRFGSARPRFSQLEAKTQPAALDEALTAPARLEARVGAPLEGDALVAANERRSKVSFKAQISETLEYEQVRYSKAFRRERKNIPPVNPDEVNELIRELESSMELHDAIFVELLRIAT